MTDPLERAEFARSAAEAARDESAELRRESWEARRRAGELVISAQRIAGEAVVLRLEGALDGASCDAVREEVAARRHAAPAIHIDRAGVEFMDSSGLRLLLGLTDRAALQLVRPSAAVMRVVEITRTAGQLNL
jgi:anti-anti-sigma factor